MADREASYLYPINEIQLGTYGAMGVQTPTLGGGGDLTAEGARDSLHSIAETGGGQLQATGRAIRGLKLACAELALTQPVLKLGTAPAPAPADLVLTLSDTTIERSPSSLVAFVANGTPEGPAVFSIKKGATVTPVLTTTFDEAGVIGGISVPLDVPTTGTYELVVDDTTEPLTVSASFTVAAVGAPLTIGVIVTQPPTQVQPDTGVRKWVFQDPVGGEVYHFAVNPSKMNSPFAPKRITFQATTAIDGNKLAFEGQTQPVEWQFSGTLFDQAQYDAFVHWLGKRNRIWITDHYGRAWLCYLTHFDPQSRRANGHPWMHDWTITVLIFEGPVEPVLSV